MESAYFHLTYTSTSNEEKQNTPYPSLILPVLRKTKYVAPFILLPPVSNQQDWVKTKTSIPVGLTSAEHPHFNASLKQEKKGKLQTTNISFLSITKPIQSIENSFLVVYWLPSSGSGWWGENIWQNLLFQSYKVILKTSRMLHRKSGATQSCPSDLIFNNKNKQKKPKKNSKKSTDSMWLNLKRIRETSVV